MQPSPKLIQFWNTPQGNPWKAEYYARDEFFQAWSNLIADAEGEERDELGAILYRLAAVLERRENAELNNSGELPQ